ncbi:hypothetical protein ES705_32456 [subsurface metagenome]
MKAIRRHLKRAQTHLYRARRSLERARRLAISAGFGSPCIAAMTKAIVDNAKAHQHIDDTAAILDATNPHYRPPRT